MSRRQMKPKRIASRKGAVSITQQRLSRYCCHRDKTHVWRSAQTLHLSAPERGTSLPWKKKTKQQNTVWNQKIKPIALTHSNNRKQCSLYNLILTDKVQTDFNKNICVKFYLSIHCNSEREKNQTLSNESHMWSSVTFVHMKGSVLWQNCDRALFQS